jgi:hypothetical protein
MDSYTLASTASGNLPSQELSLHAHGYPQDDSGFEICSCLPPACAAERLCCPAATLMRPVAALPMLVVKHTGVLRVAVVGAL